MIAVKSVTALKLVAVKYMTVMKLELHHALQLKFVFVNTFPKNFILNLEIR